jgi:hypothetical protein
MPRKTVIEIEFNETFAYVNRVEKFERYCPTCEETIEFVAPQIAAVTLNTTEREIYRLVESGRVHFLEIDRVLVCMRSIRKIEGANYL